MTSRHSRFETPALHSSAFTLCVLICLLFWLQPSSAQVLLKPNGRAAAPLRFKVIEESPNGGQGQPWNPVGIGGS